MFVKRGYKLWLVDEFRTSMLCSWCHEVLEKGFRHNLHPKVSFASLIPPSLGRGGMGSNLRCMDCCAAKAIFVSNHAIRRKGATGIEMSMLC
jgi:hypothetical protein